MAVYEHLVTVPVRIGARFRIMLGIVVSRLGDAPVADNLYPVLKQESAVTVVECKLPLLECRTFDSCTVISLSKPIQNPVFTGQIGQRLFEFLYGFIV